MAAQQPNLVVAIQQRIARQVANSRASDSLEALVAEGLISPEEKLKLELVRPPT
jgi:hypothetical protein